MPNTQPHALEGLPPLDRWTDAALPRDYTASVELDVDGKVSDDTRALRAEILRRLTR